MTDQVQEQNDRVSTGCSSLDALLGGGWERGVVSQVYGPPGSGKTNVALQSAVGVADSGGGVVYIDTEGLSLERFRQIAGDNYKEVAREFMVKEVYDFEEQASAVRDVENLASEVEFVVLDSATGLYRLERDEEDGPPLQRLTRQVTHLTGLARRYDLAVLLTNQVYTKMDEGVEEVRPLGGRMVQHWTKAIIELEIIGEGRRRAVLHKHRSRPTGERTRFSITPNGVVAGT